MLLAWGTGLGSFPGNWLPKIGSIVSLDVDNLVGDREIHRRTCVYTGYHDFSCATLGSGLCCGCLGFIFSAQWLYQPWYFLQAKTFSKPFCKPFWNMLKPSYFDMKVQISMFNFSSSWIDLAQPVEIPTKRASWMLLDKSVPTLVFIRWFRYWNMICFWMIHDCLN